MRPSNTLVASFPRCQLYCKEMQKLNVVKKQQPKGGTAAGDRAIARVQVSWYGSQHDVGGSSWRSKRNQTLILEPRVRTRRAYFDCQFGQLHVRTAFPTTGGFDEGVTLFCLHPSENTSRVFDKFLPHIGDVRSVYAPDLPGCGESDAGATDRLYANAARRGRGFGGGLCVCVRSMCSAYRFGAGVALELAAVKPELVRRLVLAAAAAHRPVAVRSSRRVSCCGSNLASAMTRSGRRSCAVAKAKYLDLDGARTRSCSMPPRRALAKSIGAILEGPGVALAAFNEAQQIHQRDGHFVRGARPTSGSRPAVSRAMECPRGARHPGRGRWRRRSGSTAN